MKKSCSYCNRIHERTHICEKKPKRQQRITNHDRFRWSNEWKLKREEIKERDLYLCQVCLTNTYDTQHEYNSKNLEVHHIISLKNGWEKRLDNDNLITLCRFHHEYAEKNVISAKELKNLVFQKHPPH